MIVDDIENLIEPLINEIGYDLWGCEYLLQGKRSLLRIYIDKTEGINIQDCEKVSKRIGALLDVSNTISGNYDLEVSSPGIPRPLFYKEQYRQYIGEDVQIKLAHKLQGKRKFTGKIISADDENLVLDIDGIQQEFLFSNIVKASLMV